MKGKFGASKVGSNLSSSEIKTKILIFRFSINLK
jgi:hypothetical protein